MRAGNIFPKSPKRCFLGFVSTEFSKYIYGVQINSQINCTTHNLCCENTQSLRKYPALASRRDRAREVGLPPLPAVLGVADERVAEVREVRADLVGAPCYRPALDERPAERR